MQTGRIRGVEEIIFCQNHWNFRFVNLPQKNPDKMKLHPWNFWNLCYTLWKFLGLYPRLVEIPHDFFIDHPCKFLFLSPGISPFYLEIPCPQSPPSPPVPFFSEIAHSHSYTDSYISSFWWVVNILLQKFYTLSKKEILTQKAAFLSLLWTRPIDLWCNMFETLEIQRKYRW